MDSKFWDERYSTAEYVWAVEPNQFVEAHIAGLAPGDAIDLGAGEGRNAVWLASRGWRVTAVDFSQVALDKGTKLASDHDTVVDFVHADATTYQAPRPVDLVLLSYLQLPASDQMVVLEHAQTWLRPGGTLFVIAHDHTNVTNGYGGPSSTDICYNVESTVDALTGLQIATATVAERRVETPSGQQTALDTLVIATSPHET
jgi:SAM-dependent methyltransferase